METKQHPLALPVSLVVVAVLGLGVYWFISALIEKLNAVNSDLGKAIIAGAVTLSVALVSVVVGKVWEQRLKLQQDVREKKVPVYEKQIETFFSVLFAPKEGENKVSEEELKKAFQGFTEKLIIWGGPEVIQAWSAFRLHAWQNSKAEQGFLKLEAFLKAIRKDLGNSNGSLAAGDLVKLFINDFQSAGAFQPRPPGAAA